MKSAILSALLLFCALVSACTEADFGYRSHHHYRHHPRVTVTPNQPSGAYYGTPSGAYYGSPAGGRGYYPSEPSVSVTPSSPYNGGSSGYYGNPNAAPGVSVAPSGPSSGAHYG